MNRSTPDAAVTINSTHNTYATLGELHLDREQDLFCDVRVGCRRARGAPPRAPATWNDGVDGALLCDLLFSLHDDRRRTGLCRSWLCYLPVTLRHPRPRQAVCPCVCRTGLDCRASTFSLLLLYVVKLYDVSVHLDLCARAPRVLQTAWSLLTFNKPVMCARLH